MPELEHILTVLAGLGTFAVGAGLLPTRWQFGRIGKTLFVIAGIGLVASGAFQYVQAGRNRATSWYVLDVSPPSCPELYAQTGLSTPDDLITRGGCQFDQTNAPGATRMFCPNENVYLYLYPDRQSCEVALETMRRNMEAFRNQSATSPSN
jgi:hypothetical protein